MTVTNVTIDTVTQTPTLSAPVNGGIFAGAFEVAYTLPEAADSESVKLVFAAAHGATSTLGLAPTSAGAHSLTIDPNNLSALGTLSSGPNVLANDTYALTVEYEDTLGNPAASSSATGFTLNRLVAPIVTTATSSAAGTSSTPSAGAATPKLGPPIGPARLRVHWHLGQLPKPHTHTLIATFAVVRGARSYRLMLTRGRAQRTGRCQLLVHSRRKQVSCVVSTSRPGRWLATVSASSAAGQTLAVATHAARFAA